jgi:hypothetical protein
MFYVKRFIPELHSLTFAAKYTLALVNMSHVKLYYENAPNVSPLLKYGYWNNKTGS